MSAPVRREVFSREEIAESWAWLGEAIAAAIHSEISHLSVSEWAEQKRIIPEGLSALPGPFRWDVTPYLREIADCMSATSPVQEIAVMKGAQVGFTVGVLENWIGYVIDAEPGPMMFVSGDKEMAEASVELRIDRMIQSSGLQDKIFSQAEKTANKKSGDTKKKKEFPGGFLLPVGPNSAAKLRTFSVRYEALDEVDSYPASSEGEGDPIGLLKRRTDSFEAIRKILYGSTPLVSQTSKIEPLFKAGDQRQYHVPCKHCGHLQPLKWAQLRWEKDELGALIYPSVRYECESCGGSWRNEDKAFFLREDGRGGKARWIPSSKPSRPSMRSYHISSLYSPIGMRSWESIVEEWIEIGDNIEKRKQFINTVLGETWTERGEAPRIERIMLRREDYAVELRSPGKVTQPDMPAGALLLTLGGDVQKDRIECELVAWGVNKESWSLGYFVIPGETANSEDHCWDELEEIILSPHGEKMISLSMIDSGYNSPVVYQFCDRFDGGVFPVKGESRAARFRRQYMLKDVPGYACKRIDLYTDDLKLEIYSSVVKGLPENPEAPIPHGFCHFPSEYGEKYFRQLTAEERVKETTRTGQSRLVWHKPEGRRNEALDCRVYALGALYVLATLACESEDGAVDWSMFWGALQGNR